DRALEQFFRRIAEGLAGGEALVEFFQDSEEACDLLVPGFRFRGLPIMTSFADGERPLDEVADVGENLERRARTFSASEIREIGGSAAQCLSAAVGEGGEGVAERDVGRWSAVVGHFVP